MEDEHFDRLLLSIINDNTKLLNLRVGYPDLYPFQDSEMKRM